MQIRVIHMPVTHNHKDKLLRKLCVRRALNECLQAGGYVTTLHCLQQSTFAKFYQLDAVANFDAEFGRRVLMLAGSSTPALYNWSGYRIPRAQHARQ